MRDEAYPCGAENSVHSDEKLERYAMKKAFQKDDDMTVLNDTREATVMEGARRMPAAALEEEGRVPSSIRVECQAF